MYKNFLLAMKAEGITFYQIGSLLGCSYQMVKDIVNGETQKGFYYDDAIVIQEVLFPKYSRDYLFERVKSDI